MNEENQGLRSEERLALNQLFQELKMGEDCEPKIEITPDPLNFISTSASA